MHPNISQRRNMSYKSIKDDKRKERWEGRAAVNVLLPEAKYPELNMSSDSFFIVTASDFIFEAFV